MGPIKRLRKVAKERGATVEHKGNGHYQVKGALLVNWFPKSKSMTAYVAGTTSSKRGVSEPEQVVAMAFSQPELIGRKDARRTSKAARWKNALWNKGHTKCCFCSVELTKEQDKDNTWSLEHVIPLARGGLENANNRDLSCAKCNKERGSNMPELKKCSPSRAISNE